LHKWAVVQWVIYSVQTQLIHTINKVQMATYFGSYWNIIRPNLFIGLRKLKANSHMQCRAHAILRQFRVPLKSPRGSRKYLNC
jgi:hypothetical protein